MVAAGIYTFLIGVGLLIVGIVLYRIEAHRKKSGFFALAALVLLIFAVFTLGIDPNPDLDPLPNRSDREEPAAEIEESTQTNQTRTKTHIITDQIADFFRQVHAIEAKPALPGEGLCRADGYCSFLVEDFTVNVWGRGIIDVQTTSRAPQSSYREVCSAIVSATTGANIDFVAESMAQIFRQASRFGSAKIEFEGLEIEVRPSLDNIYGCYFFKF